MPNEDHFQQMYKEGHTPWDIGEADFNLIEVVTQKPIPACRALDIGCGTGDNSIWLAGNGFRVVGTDASDIAIGKAKEKASNARVECALLTADFLKDRIGGGPFGFVFDRGCFHAFGSEKDRIKFAQNVAAHLDDGGLWLTLVGNADEKRKGPGPPQRTAGDIIRAVEPYFEILSLVSTHFGSHRPDPPKAWRGLLKKRDK